MSNKRISGSLVGGIILIALGLLSLFGQIFRGFPFLSYLWPFIIIGFGGLFFVGMLAGGKSMAGLAIPGAIISGLGLMMFIQNLTGYWQSWAYSWTVILVLVGLGIFIMGLYTEDTASPPGRPARDESRRDPVHHLRRFLRADLNCLPALWHPAIPLPGPAGCTGNIPGGRPFRPVFIQACRFQ
jgi:hypothetical protein